MKKTICLLGMLLLSFALVSCGSAKKEKQETVVQTGQFPG